MFCISDNVAHLFLAKLSSKDTLQEKVENLELLKEQEGRVADVEAISLSALHQNKDSIEEPTREQVQN